MAHTYPGRRREALPLRALKAGARATQGFLSAVGRVAAHGLTFVPAYLTNLLWLLSQAFLDLARGGYAGNSAVYAVIRTLTQAVCEPPLCCGTQTDPNADPVPLPADHPLSRLLRTPNPLVSQYELKELVVIHLAITGRSVWWKERNTLGDVIALWPLRPDRVGPVYSNAADTAHRVISGWSYLVPGTVHYEWIPREDTVFWNLPDPAGDSGGMVEGLGPLQVLASEVGADNEATRYVGALLANNGQPGLVIHTKVSLKDPAAVEQIKAAARAEFGGIRRGAVAVLDADTTFDQTGFNLQQLEFPALRDVAESRIAAAIGVPAVLAGLQVGLRHGQAYAAVQAIREYFAETTCSTYWRRLETGMTRDLAADFGEHIVCWFDLRQVRALQVHLQNEIDDIKEGFQAGAITVDEYREKVLRLPPLGGMGGQIRILPRGAVQVDADGQLVQALPQEPGNEVQAAQEAGGTDEPPEDEPPEAGKQPAKHPGTDPGTDDAPEDDHPAAPRTRRRGRSAA